MSRGRLQGILDAADHDWFARHPDAVQRVRYYFIGEQIAGTSERHRMVVVTKRTDGTLVRSFLTNEGGTS